jgi:hypothetical protein
MVQRRTQRPPINYDALQRRRPTNMDDLPYQPGRAPEDPPAPPVAPAKPATTRRRKAAATTAGRKSYKRRSTTSRKAQAKVQPRDSAGRFSFGQITDFITAKKLRENIKANVRLAKQGARENSPILRGTGPSKKRALPKRRRVVRRGTAQATGRKPTKREIEQFHQEHEKKVNYRWGVLGQIARRITGREEQ